MAQDTPPHFRLGEAIPLEETRSVEFKEVKGGNPVAAIIGESSDDPLGIGFYSFRNSGLL